MNQKVATGYLSPQYADSFAEFGLPTELPKSGGWILKRKIADTFNFDAMGCYPLFMCKDWSKLVDDIANLKGNLVSLALVSDPFGKYDEKLLKNTFGDVVYPYKQHYIVNMKKPFETIVSKHHRYYANKALKILDVEICDNPSNFVDDWINLYSMLVLRHNITGIRKFSRAAFIKQLKVPGIVMLRALYQKICVGINLWYTNENRCYSHLAAYDDIGYKIGASYALYWKSLEYFHKRVEWLDLGAGAGLRNQSSDGLSQFKKGWSNESKSVYFCGKILHHDKYSLLTKNKIFFNNNYFPLYREGEF